MTKLSTASQTLMAIATGFVLSLGAANVATAQSATDTAARVNATIKPCFGALINMKSCSRSHSGKQGKKSSVTLSKVKIDCSKISSSDLASKLNRLRDGGELILDATHGSCRGPLIITKSLTITGLGNWGLNASSRPHLSVGAGQPCVLISSTARRVRLKNLHLASDNSGGASCIDTSSPDTFISQTLVLYNGDAHAIMARNGNLTLNERSFVVSKSREPAIRFDRIQASFDNSIIATTSDAVKGTLDGDSAFSFISLLQLSDWYGFERGEGASGLHLEMIDPRSILRLTGLDLAYFAKGIDLEGPGEMLISSTRVIQSIHAVTSNVDRVRILDSTLYAQEVGIHVRGGEAYIGNNFIDGISTTAILTDKKATLKSKDNKIRASESVCARMDWGSIPPEERRCAPWYESAAFTSPEHRNDLSILGGKPSAKPHGTEDDADPGPRNGMQGPDQRFGHKFVKTWTTNPSYTFDNYRSLWAFFADADANSKPKPYLPKTQNANGS